MGEGGDGGDGVRVRVRQASEQEVVGGMAGHGEQRAGTAGGGRVSCKILCTARTSTDRAVALLEGFAVFGLCCENATATQHKV